MKSYFDLDGDGGSAILDQVLAKRQAIAERLASVRAILAVGSGKGGVGKSTVTALLAAAASARGLEVAVLDGDLNGPSQARLAGLGQAPLLPGKGGLEMPRGGAGFGVVSLGSVLERGEMLSFDSVAEGDTYTWRAIRELAMLGDLLLAVDWGALDLLLIDLPPGADRTQHYAEVLGPRAIFLLVSTPSDLAREVVARSLGALETTGHRVLGYVENMAGYYCRECGEVRPLFPSDREAELPLERLGAIPFDPEVARRLDSGEAVVQAGSAGTSAPLDRPLDPPLGPTLDETVEQTVEETLDRLLQLLDLASRRGAEGGVEVSL